MHPVIVEPEFVEGKEVEFDLGLNCTTFGVISGEIELMENSIQSYHLTANNQVHPGRCRTADP